MFGTSFKNKLLVRVDLLKNPTTLVVGVCQTVNDVIDDISRLNDIENDICNFKCSNEQCHKILQTLPVVYRNAIGEQ